MSRHVENMIIGQGLAGSAIAWTLYQANQTVFLIDSGDPNTASRVAAGLVTPFTGKRMVQSPEFDEDWMAAKQFYRRVEECTAQQFFKEQPMIRLQRDDTPPLVNRSDEASITTVNKWQGTLRQGAAEHKGITMSPAGRLDVPLFLSATKTFFEQQQCYESRSVDIDGDIRMTEHNIQLSSRGITAKRLILCQGSVPNSMFPEVPNNPSRGDILSVRIPDYACQLVVHRSIWIAPEADGTQTVGSTYDWKYQSSAPTVAGRTELLHQLSRIVAGTVSVESHRAAVRPTMKDYDPVVARHPQHQNVFILNGLGSKGTLKAPRLAAELLAIMNGSAAEKPEHGYQRLRPAKASTPLKLTQMAQNAVQAVLKIGETAIDATVGNGFDTCFLAKTVGETGQVVGFDIQQEALDATEHRLAANGYQNVQLKNQSHAELAVQMSPETVAAVMFNLGYLPRCDHSVVTTAASSTTAITAAIKLLQQNGILTVLAYRGHPGGEDEYVAVERLLSGYAHRYDLQRIVGTPGKKNSPVLFVLRKSPHGANDEE